MRGAREVGDEPKWERWGEWDTLAILASDRFLDFIVFIISAYKHRQSRLVL